MWVCTGWAWESRVLMEGRWIWVLVVMELGRGGDDVRW